MSKDQFLRGAFILTVAGLSVKVIGSVNRILLSRLLGGEGIGLYQMAYPIYLLALAVSSSGIPVAISIMISERLALSDRKGAGRVFKISILVMAVLGLFFAALLYFGAGWLVERHIVRDPRAYTALVALTPAVFFATILACYRGYFQGFQTMTPTAVSQIAEQFVRVVTMIVFAYLLLPHGLEYAAAGASFGAGPGALAGILILLYFYRKHKAAQKNDDYEELVVTPQPAGEIMSRLLKLAVPVSLANIMVPMVASIDALMVPARLETAGYSVEQATTLFGYLAGMAMPLVLMATIPTTSLAASLVPAISEAFTLKDNAGVVRRLGTAMRLVSLITIPCFVGLTVLSGPIARLLYASPGAALPIAIIGPGIFFLGLHQVSAAVLQGMNKAAIPMMNMLISAVVKIAMVWVLTADPAYGIAGAAWASNVDFAMAAMLNLYFLRKYTGFVFPFGPTARILLAAGLMGACAFGVHYILSASLSSNIAALVAIAAGGAVYAILLLALGCVTKEEIARFPVVGGRLVNILAKLGLLRDEI